jgi:hypothetical protein
MNICIRIRIPVPGTLCDFSTDWTGSVSHVTPGIRDAYTEYKERPHYYREAPHISHGYIVYRPDNDPYFPTYIARISDIQDTGVGSGAGSGAGARACSGTETAAGVAATRFGNNPKNVFGVTFRCPGILVKS